MSLGLNGHRYIHRECASRRSTLLSVNCGPTRCMSASWRRCSSSTGTKAGPALSRHGENKLVGYFVGDVGTLNQIVHFVEGRGRCRPAAALGGGVRRRGVHGVRPGLRPLVQTQENKLLLAAPWGPHP